MKTLSDRDVGIDCDFVAEGDTDEEVLEAAENHIKEMHPDDFPKVRTRLTEAIRDG